MQRKGLSPEFKINFAQNEKGFTLVELLIVVTIITIISAIALPNLFGAKLTANESSAISSCRTLTEAQATYWGAHTPHTYGSLGDLETDGIINGSLALGTKTGYTFIVVAGANNWNCTASPVNPGITGNRGFYVDQTNVIRADESGTADQNSPPID